jgi:L-ribulokinase
MTQTPDTPAETHVVGVGYGTLSGRAVVVRVSDGAELAGAVHAYRHGVVERELPPTNEALPPDWALQMPGDWLEVLWTVVLEALRTSGIDPASGEAA